LINHNYRLGKRTPVLTIFGYTPFNTKTGSEISLDYLKEKEGAEKRGCKIISSTSTKVA
jgi:hypothetical protein